VIGTIVPEEATETPAAPDHEPEPPLDDGEREGDEDVVAEKDEEEWYPPPGYEDDSCR
jgi:hypothetical protein